MEPIGEIVEIFKPGGDAPGQPALHRNQVKFVHGGLDQVGKHGIVFHMVPLGDIEHLLLRHVDHGF